ncbi:unnamed protein product, partial [Lymnaea stagnalis]
RLSGSRSSGRIKNMKSEGHMKKHAVLVDSAYDADEEFSTPNSSPSQIVASDPYDINMDEDVPFIKAKKQDKKKIAPQKVKKSTGVQQLKQVNKKKQLKTNSTSTPVLLNSSDTEVLKTKQTKLKSPSGTPEVTPILPVKTFESATASDDSFITPQIRRSTRKRGCDLNQMTDITVQLNYSSQADSGIALSPPSKKICTEMPAKSLADKNLNQENHTNKKITHIINANTGEKRRCSAFGLQFMNRRNIFSPNSKKNTAVLQDFGEVSKDVNDSCFGFDSLGSPQVSPPQTSSPQASPPQTSPSQASPRQNKPKEKKKVKKMSRSKSLYRSVQNNLSDSSPSSVSKDIRSKKTENSQENMPMVSLVTPSLFSDEIFSADSGRLQFNSSVAYNNFP